MTRGVLAATAALAAGLVALPAGHGTAAAGSGAAAASSVARSVRAPADGGATGLVVASVGRGNLSTGQLEGVRAVSERGVPVVMSSRTMAGPVPVAGPPRDGVVGAGPLDPQQARVLLTLTLTETDDPERLAEIFALAR